MPYQNPYLTTPQPLIPPPSAAGAAGTSQNIIASAIPGFGGLTKSATDIIQNMLSPNQNAATARLKNSYFGAGSGLGSTSDFLRNRGFDLYGQQAKQNNQTGIDDLLKMLSTYSGTVVPTPGEQIGAGENAANFSRQTNNDNEQRWNDYTASREQDSNNWDAERGQTIASNPLNRMYGAGGTPSLLQRAGYNNFMSVGIPQPRRR